MNIDFHKYLVCPISHTELTYIPSNNPSTDRRADWQEGILVGATGWIYPVINSIPRMNIESCVEYKEFILNNFPQQASFYHDIFPAKEEIVTFALKKNRNTRKSFSMEWADYNFDKGKTWGQSKEGILQRFLTETGETLESLRDRIILDAGAGNGHLDMILAENGIDVIAMDFSNSLERVGLLNSNKHLFIVQGDVQFPPIRFNSCDIVHCSGVLIHTNNTEKSFHILANCVKKDGKYSVWLYHPRKDFLHSLLLLTRKLMKPLPLTLKRWICRLLILPPSFLIKKIKGNKESIQEMMISLLDFFTPEFRWEHDPQEVKSWFDRAGFILEEVTTYDTFGFNITGIKK